MKTNFERNNGSIEIYSTNLRWRTSNREYEDMNISEAKLFIATWIETRSDDYQRKMRELLNDPTVAIRKL